MSHPSAGAIGPNALIQTAAALEAHGGRALAERVLGMAGLPDVLDAPPARMVDERQVARLNRAVFEALPEPEALSVLSDAGKRTGRYVLENRIPAAARRILPALPSRVSSMVLLQAIRRNGWTFAGSGRVTVQCRRPEIVITANPIPLPGCVWHVGAFAFLLGSLVTPDARVTHMRQVHGGLSIDRFAIDLQQVRPAGDSSARRSG